MTSVRLAPVAAVTILLLANRSMAQPSYLGTVTRADGLSGEMRMGRFIACHGGIRRCGTKPTGPYGRFRCRGPGCPAKRGLFSFPLPLQTQPPLVLDLTLRPASLRTVCEARDSTFRPLPICEMHASILCYSDTVVVFTGTLEIARQLPECDAGS